MRLHPCFPGSIHVHVPLVVRSVIDTISLRDRNTSTARDVDVICWFGAARWRPAHAAVAVRRSAASTVLRNSMAIVVGPTPPTRGRDPAGDLLAALVDVGQQAPALVAHAAADDDRARAGCARAGGCPARRRRRPRSAPAGCTTGQSGTPVWTTVTAALAVGRFSDSSIDSGRPSVNPRPRIDDLTPGDRDLVVGEQRLDAGRRARQRAGHAERQPTHVHRVLAVGVLVRIELGRAPPRSRCAAGSGAASARRRPRRRRSSSRTAATTSACVASSGRWTWRAAEAELGGAFLLDADVAGRRRVAADEDRAERRGCARRRAARRRARRGRRTRRRRPACRASSRRASAAA